MANSTYNLLKTLRKEAGMQVGPQSGGAGGAGGAGGKIPPGFLAGMNQRKEEEAAAAKEESETAQAQAMDDAAKQQDMQIKQVEMEQRIREQNSQKMQEMQAEQSRLQTEAASMKEQMKQKDLMHKEQLKHQNELVKAQLQHQQTLDKQVEAHKSRMQTGFSSTLVSRSKSLRSSIEKLHKMACAKTPFGKPKMSPAFLSLCKAAGMVPATPKQQPGSGPATPKSMTASKVGGGVSSIGAGKTPLDTAPKPTSNSVAATTTTTTPTQSSAIKPGTNASLVQHMNNTWNNRVNNEGYWSAWKNMRSDVNSSFDNYYSEMQKPKTFGQAVGYLGTRGLQGLRQGIDNVGAYVGSTAAQGFGHAGEHFKDSGRRWSAANTAFDQQKADQAAARASGQKAIDDQWNRDIENGGYIDAVRNYFTGKYNPNAETDSWHNQLGDWVDRSWNWTRDGLGGAASSVVKGLANTGTAAVETGINMTGVGAAIGAAASDPNEQSRGWDLFNTDAELAQQKQQEDADRKRILDETSPNTDPNSFSTPSLIPNGTTLASGNGMNDLMRLQHTGFANQDVIGSAMQSAVDPITGMMMPFTQTDGYSLNGGYEPNDMLSAFQSSPFHTPGYQGNYNALDQAFFNRR